MTTARSAAPTIGAIADHWAPRSILADGTIVACHGVEPRPACGIHPVEDAGEVSCFACGWYSERAGGVDGPRGGAGLERAPVVPHALGGANEPGNFALLCATCHLNAPDTTDAAWFWRWIATHPADGTPWVAATRRADEMLRLIPADQRSIAAALVLRGPDEIAERMVAAGREIGAVHHQGRFSAATLARVFLHAAQQL